MRKEADVPELSPPSRERRLSPRRAAKGVLKAVCRQGTLEIGPNLALSVLDLSETGARLVVNEALEPGRRVYVNLEGALGDRPILRGGSVVWSLPTADGAFCVGVQFHKPLQRGDLLSLT